MGSEMCIRDRVGEGRFVGAGNRVLTQVPLEDLPGAREAVTARAAGSADGAARLACLFDRLSALQFAAEVSREGSQAEAFLALDSVLFHWVTHDQWVTHDKSVSYASHDRERRTTA